MRVFRRDARKSSARYVNVLQYRYVVPAPTDWMSVSVWLYKISWITSQNVVKHINDSRSLQIKAMLSSVVIHASRLRKLNGTQMCGRV